MPVATQLRIKYSDLFDDNPLPFADYFIGASKENLFASIPLLVNLASPGGEKSAAELVKQETLNTIWNFPFIYPIPTNKKMNKIQKEAIEDFTNFQNLRIRHEKIVTY